MTTFHCQYSQHQGSRLVTHPNDRWVKKVTYRRADAKVRRNEVAVRGPNRCTECMDKEVEEAEWIRQEQTDTMF